jgi:hypothetical protein
MPITENNSNNFLVTKLSVPSHLDITTYIFIQTHSPLKLMYQP